MASSPWSWRRRCRWQSLLLSKWTLFISSTVIATASHGQRVRWQHTAASSTRRRSPSPRTSCRGCSGGTPPFRIPASGPNALRALRSARTLHLIPELPRTSSSGHRKIPDQGHC
eukprot:16430365-Heterocapsa_arctica.AAC.1